MWAWLASKLTAPILLALSVLLAAGMVVQTVRLDGVSFFGWYAIDGYKPMYTMLVAKNAANELARSKAALKLTQDQQNALAAKDAQWSGVVSGLTAKLEGLQNRIDEYVPKTIAVACVPTRLIVLLDAAGSGADQSDIPAAASIPDGECSGVSVRDAEAILVQDLGQLPVLKARIANARDAWDEQRQITTTTP